MKRLRAGEVVSRVFRVLRYAGIVTAPSVVLTFVKVYGQPWWVAFVFVPAVVFFWWVDPIIQRGEMQYSNTNNEEWQRSDKLPSFIQIDNDDLIVIEMETSTPYGMFKDHQNKYPPKKAGYSIGKAKGRRKSHR